MAKLSQSLRTGVCFTALLTAGALPDSAAAQNPPKADTGGVEEIVVTATRHEQSLQLVPIAITALTSAKLTESNVTDLRNIERLSPGIQIQQQFVPGNAVFQIRGQVQSDTSPAIDPSVGVYFDDVYIARSTGSLVNLVDVARVEVLKGPQGTLFGKNTTGGAIRLVSNRPTHDFEGYVDASYESYNRTILNGVVNLPIDQKVALRVAAQYEQKSDGAVTNAVTGKNIDHDRTYFARSSLLIEPTDALSVLLEGDFTQTTTGGLPAFLKAFVPGNDTSGASELEVGIEKGLWNFTLAGVPAAIAGGRAVLLNSVLTADSASRTGSDLRDVTAPSFAFTGGPPQGLSFVGGNPSPMSRSKIWGLGANITYDLGIATLRSITSYRHTAYSAAYDVDGTSFYLLDSLQHVHSKQVSQELLLNGKALQDRLDWTVGGLYFDETPFESDKALPVAVESSLFTGTAGTTTNGDAKNKSWGVFGQGTYQLTQALSVTGGARLSKDQRSFVASAFDFHPNGSESCTYNAANGLSLLPIFSAPCSLSQSKKFSQWSYTGSINYQLDPSKLLYFRTSRGYRAGGFNPRINAPEVVGSFQPEIVVDYEGGLKADWLDRKLRTNVAIFHSLGHNVQQTVNGVSATNGAAITTTKNIGSRVVNGVELESTVRPTSYLTIDGGLTYMHARSHNPAELDVTWVQLTPAWTWTVGGTADVPISDDFDGRFRLDLSYRGKMHDGEPLRDLATGGFLYVGEYKDIMLLNSRFTIHQASSGVEFAVYGRNLTNQHYEARETTISGLGIVIANRAESRVFGLEVKIPFGSRAKN
ncbi:MAG: TonB-dependent receptor [Rhodospirillaceae bacterium]|nr:MAG: TonB-dependent receptor [Rhodospirillaceae bacterium]